MHIFEDWSSDYSFGTHYLMNFRDFGSTHLDDKSLLLCHGGAVQISSKRPTGYKRYVYIECEEPTTMLYYGKIPPERNTPVKWSVDNWDLIPQACCPNVTKYLNDIQGTDKYVSVLDPIHPKWHDPTAEKIYSVAYCGGTHECQQVIETSDNKLTMLRKFIEVIREFPDSIHISAWPAYDSKTATHLNITDADKMYLLNRTKIQVIKNWHIGPYKASVKKLPDWDKYEWTSHIDDNWASWVKSRVAEACICKNLMLVHRDPWNEIEKFFKPDEHFIYFDDADDLRVKIHECLEDWDTSKRIAESAYREYMKKHCLNAFYYKYLQPWDNET